MSLGLKPALNTVTRQGEKFGNHELLLTKWRLQNAALVHASPERISQPGFDDSQWLPATVPGTVLGAYVAAGSVPNPWYGDQISRIDDALFSRNDFWFRTSFTTPTPDHGGRTWLIFEGINWKAEIFLNGSPVGRIDGAFIRGRFDITSTAKFGEPNCLAVLVRHAANPGPGPNKVTRRKLGSPTTNGDVLGADSPTFLASAGWNWLPAIPGRNIGIWNHVRLEFSGDVILIDPWVTTDLPLPQLSPADLTVRTEVRNCSSRRVCGLLAGVVRDAAFSQPVALEPGETRQVELNAAACPALRIANPRLWWPNGSGEPVLHTLDLRFEFDGRVSDRKTVTFGMRKLSHRVIGGVLTLFVNGERVLCRGGNWGMEEGMLDCSRDGYDLRVRLHRDANLVMIRNWVGMVGREEFYDACDRHGILVWDDFWLANPVDGPEPADHAMFLANARDKIRRVRGHPSVALYCGRNEGNPPPDLDRGMKEAVESLDGSRCYIPHSAAGAVTGFGPYEVQDVDWYFANCGGTFHSELGIVAVPAVESMRAMMPAEFLWPINDMWAFHDYQSPRAPLYTQRIERRYGPAAGIEDYCRKAQMVNLETAKAMFEALQANQGAGLLLWMSQPAWPSLICQLYDYYFEPTAAYFGAKCACEPVHIFWDSCAQTVKAANDTPVERNGLVAEARVYGLDGRESWRKSVPVRLAPSSAAECFALERPGEALRSFFVKLFLRHDAAIVSENFYWSSGKSGSCADLETMPRVALEVSAAKSVSGGNCRIRVCVANPTHGIALMIRLRAVRARSGERVLPVFYSDNYFSLLPGESRDVFLEFAIGGLAGELPKVLLEGWNVLPLGAEV